MNPKPALARRLAASAALTLITAVVVGTHPAAAQYERGSQYGYGRPYSYERDPDYEYRRAPQHRRETKREPAGQSRNMEGAPLLAVVALGEQRVTIYNAHGKMLQSLVSTGATGLETPAGIFSVVQKKEFHQSNVYADGNMPFMQRITWTGFALHGGVLPGYAASHGCAMCVWSLTKESDFAGHRHDNTCSDRACPGMAGSVCSFRDDDVCALRI